MSLHISVIIPIFNCWELTRACLSSLRRHTLGDYLEVIAVDNHSSDLTATELGPLGKGLFGDNFHLLRQERNLGFAAACNLGAGGARAPYLFFLNNDTLLTPNWSAPLLSTLRESSRLGAIGPLLLYPEAVWTRPLLVPNLEGQYIIKNAALVALALGLVATTTPLSKRKLTK